MAFLFSCSAFAQKHKVDVVKYVHMTTAERDALVVSAGESWEIFNVTTGKKEYHDGASWVALAASTDAIFETELTDAQNNIDVGFNLISTSLIYYNGKIVPNNRWSGEGTQILNLSLDTKQYDNLTVKN